jgi:hypothetical protein
MPNTEVNAPHVDARFSQLHSAVALNDQLAQEYAEAVHFGRPIPSYSLSAWTGTTLHVAMLWNDQRCDMLEVAKRDCAADAHALAQGRPAPLEAR